MGHRRVNIIDNCADGGEVRRFSQIEAFSQKGQEWVIRFKVDAICLPYNNVSIRCEMREVAINTTIQFMLLPVRLLAVCGAIDTLQANSHVSSRSAQLEEGKKPYLPHHMLSKV